MVDKNKFTIYNKYICYRGRRHIAWSVLDAAQP